MLLYRNVVVGDMLDLTSEVLLLDEADIFLEERGIANLECNSLVAGNLFIPLIIYTSDVTTSLSSNPRVL
jgi:hypothetical protein